MNKEAYKETLNLPQTDFPMRANLSQREPTWLARWKEIDLYAQQRKQAKGKKKFILHMGPPYANGDIHIGHAVTTILKDIIVKYKGLCGLDAPLVPGWDCHGLPIEVNVEKKIGLPNVDVSPEQFREACRTYASSQVALQKASFIRLGILADWEHPYLTMTHTYEAQVIRSIGVLLQKGYLRPGAKPVHWCTRCSSALAEAEVEYKDKTSPAIDVNFHVVEPAAFLKCIGVEEPITEIAFVVWTTTPWTLPANQAVALHPDLEYVLVALQDSGTEKGEKIDYPVKYICVLKDLLSGVLARIACKKHVCLRSFLGRQVENQILQHPFYERKIPIILGEHVTTEAGTGVVHTAPGHGLEDYLVGLRYGLPVDNPVADNGCFLETTPLVGGLFVLKANEKIIEILKAKKTLMHATTIEHSYPHCWRHKTPIIFRATPQWFITMETHDLRKRTLKEIEKVEWFPTWGQSRMKLMVENRPDWCISRQRTWGIPLPLILHKETGALHPQMDKIIDVVAQEVDKSGIEGWYTLDIHTLPYEDMEQYRKSEDVLDVWFESGVSHTSVLKSRACLAFPAEVYLEGSDQHRGWFQTALLSSLAMYHTAPYKTVITHGFTVDQQGRKMSKSLGNVIAPEKIVNTLGADVLRLWVASTDYKTEIHVSEEILKRMSDAYRRIRNTIRFLLANLHGFDPQASVAPVSCIALDAWIIDYTAQLQTEILQAYETYQFHHVYQKIHHFCVVELGSFYLDIIKDRQYTTKTQGLPRRSAQTAMYYIAHAIIRWLAPILSFTAEEAWFYLPGTKASSVFLSEWEDKLPILPADHAMGNDFWQRMIKIKEQVNKALELQRLNNKIGAPLEAQVTLFAQGTLYESLQSIQEELRFVFITSEVLLKPFDAKGTDAQPTSFEDLFVLVEQSPYEKCVRCWHRRADVHVHSAFPGLCARCVENVDPNAQGEERHYA